MALQHSYPLTLYRDSMRGRIQELFSAGVLSRSFSFRAGSCVNFVSTWTLSSTDHIAMVVVGQGLRRQT